MFLLIRKSALTYCRGRVYQALRLMLLCCPLRGVQISNHNNRRMGPGHHLAEMIGIHTRPDPIRSTATTRLAAFTFLSFEGVGHCGRRGLSWGLLTVHRNNGGIRGSPTNRDISRHERINRQDLPEFHDS